MPYRIVPIVEGQGEERAVRILLNRVMEALHWPAALEVARPIRQKKGSLLKAGGIEAAVGLAAIAMGPIGTILILLDSDGDCPRDLAPALAARAKNARNDKRISVVLAHQEYEAWFLASASSLRNVHRLSVDITDHENPESVQGCKEWLERWLPPASRYSEAADQAALTEKFDLALARRASSFEKFWREVEGICQQPVPLSRPKPRAPALETPSRRGSMCA